MLRTPSETSVSQASAGVGALRDTAELIEAACQLAPLSEEGRRRVVEPALRAGEEALLSRLRFRFDRAGLKIPSTRVTYKGLTVERAAAVGASVRVPTVASVLHDALRRAAGRGRGGSVRALDGVAGLLRPGTMTLLLGPPGSGKTTLLRALTGRLPPDRYTRVEGTVRHNGHDTTTFSVVRSSAYVGQSDQHLAALTVRETLNFSEACLGPSEVAGRLLRGVAEWEAAHGVEKSDEDEKADSLMAHWVAGHHGVMTEYMLMVLGLQHAGDTLVGDAMLRGISGGEKRRVTAGEMLVSNAQVFCLDAISNGLDSAATLDIVASLRRTARLIDATVAVSLLQPEPEVVALFDEIIVLSEGRVIWHGPASKALLHFASLGFQCPPGLDVADFLLLVASPQDHAMLAGPAGGGAPMAYTGAAMPAGSGAMFTRSVPSFGCGKGGGTEPGAVDWREWTAKELSDAFWASDDGHSLQAAIHADISVPPEQDHTLLFTAKYGAPWHTMLAACLRRAVTLEWRRNWPALVVRWLISLVISVVAGSIFWQLPATFQGAVSAMGMLFWVLCFVLVVTVPTVELTYSRRSLMLRQRRDRFYAGWMEAVPQVLVNLPVLAVDVLVMGIPVYFMVGFTPASGPFLTFLLIMLALNVAVDNFYRLLGAIMPSLPVGIAIGVTILISFELLAGFTISPAKIPQPWKLVYYLNPLAHAYRAAALNELRAPRWTSQPAPAAAAFAPAPAAASATGGGLDGEAAAVSQVSQQSLSEALIAFFELELPGDWVWLGIAVLLAWSALYVAGVMVAYSLFKPLPTKAVVVEDDGEQREGQQGKEQQRAPGADAATMAAAAAQGNGGDGLSN
ncbi:hypothetical protein MNEG_1936 [Monoraphidium neglectum]|uniref:ABC transporter domain-containing protein n=1 Tax=Monoraphidium neglectum TaxID=145388 RepID=A0A0D2LHR5_9CHLO|nr:hypothetical protein MNEG_1936 [Monoraphidium neglectum]KIZ06029.1 hypothetical protein MNEG_1936 [Monoraphidium neglectum]|eukprot:XP_013905048.1 hypothetical protein MNEG_1936 [Monoraphidium neglectum]